MPRQTRERQGMDWITLEDYRCFHMRQCVRLAPLTLIVGENSTGKTSFLALIRALWDVAFEQSVPNFKEEPYDLGSFAEIAHHRGGSAGRATSFCAGFGMTHKRWPRRFSIEVTFHERGTVPFPVSRHLWNEKLSVTAKEADRGVEVVAKSRSGVQPEWRQNRRIRLPSREGRLVPLHFFGSPRDLGVVDDATRRAVRSLLTAPMRRGTPRPFASAPVRSKPRRTYDPSLTSRDPEGDYVPMFLAHTFRQKKGEWSTLKSKLEDFGKASGLFDEIVVSSLRPRDSDPFQLQVRKYGRRLRGPMRNLIDVGYGVSQVLPVITELLRQDAPSMFLLQQPEVHLHPSAQAALGSLFCEVAKQRRQIVVETHSDYLINRVRMDVRDRTVPLSPDDVSILYFERDELDVTIHSMCIDEDGNLTDSPDSYGRFFLNETNRSLAF